MVSGCGSNKSRKINGAQETEGCREVKGQEEDEQCDVKEILQPCEHKIPTKILVSSEIL